jgi:hypothetical protein
MGLRGRCDGACAVGRWDCAVGAIGLTMTLIWLALRNITAKWARSSYYWKPAMNQFAILYEDRFTAPKP